MTENNNIIFCKEEALSNAEIDRATFRLLAAFYNYNPDRNFIEALMNLTSGSVPMNGISSAVSMITKYACEAVRSDELVTELKRDWTKLFRGVAPDYGPKAPYEQLYVNSGSLKLISVLAQEYQCNGFAEYMEIITDTTTSAPNWPMLHILLPSVSQLLKREILRNIPNIRICPTALLKTIRQTGWECFVKRLKNMPQQIFTEEC
ncbi:MAG: hypothetical protein LRY50_12320 [Geovibrio sp.]|nr:hypothetical protein [Geovibrio sp.]